MTKRREFRFELLDTETPERPPAAVASATRLGDLESQYEIIRELGRGGTAIVYQARERELARDVAIKVIRPTYVDDTEAVARLSREAKLVALLRHPNIVPIFGARQLRDGSLALIMQYVPGRTLKRTVRDDGPLPIPTVVSILSEIGLALDYAHSRHRVVHRDIKPENIYLDADLGRAMLSDFGIARTADSDTSITVAGTALGTPAYMSPEQIDGIELDGRSDLYSLGLIAWEMLTGRQPWAGDNLYSIIYRQKHEDLPALTEFRTDVPPYLQRAIDGLLRKDREERWSDAGEFLARLHLTQTLPRIAPPAVTFRRGSAQAEIPRDAATLGAAPDDSLTVVYRREDVRDAPGQITAADVRDEQSLDKQSLDKRVGVIAAADTPVDTAAPAVKRAATPYAAVALKPRSRRKPIIVGLFLFLIFMAAGNAPVIPTADSAGATTAAPEQEAPPPAAPEQPVLTAAGEHGPPARLLVLVGEGGSGRAGEPLLSGIALLVEDSLGRPVRGAAVEFTVAGGGGDVQPRVAASDSFGVASAVWTLGVRAGSNEVTAAVKGVAGAISTIRAIGHAGLPARLVAQSGNGQAAPRGSTLPAPVQVRVEDEHGNPVADAIVEFAVTAGGGSATPEFARSDTLGVAQTQWTLGRGTETNALRAGLPQSSAQAVFSAQGRHLLAAQIALVAGGTHTCMLNAQGALSCWGGNDGGQLGAGTTSRVSGATEVRSSFAFARVAPGVAHTCALDRDGAAHCWGGNDSGQLGTGDRAAHATPATVRGVESFVALTAGLAHTCALAADGRAFCWGGGTSGQIGDGSGADRTAPVRVAGNHTFTTLSAGWRHTCGLTAQNAAWCWGTNGSGQLGDGATADRAAPTRVSGSHSFSSIATGAAHTCALNRAGEAYCWGQNRNGQLGDGSRTDRPAPARVDAPAPFATVTSGAVHTCALTRDGQAYCWGSNSFGQLGNDGAGDSPVPVEVAGDLRFSSLSASGSHTCGRTDAGERYCWGYNVDGQLGDGTRTDRAAPVRVSVATR